ncbi:hypothetical protein AMATHDRAFT_183195 [Amanita thiersii Skay4041]|uniref:GP-PDE domain-containing protein n=1 Tax=Amanita thiersii Skay4041 TaxID=703135 RepID=A0A2A9NFZ8_9AGAR|nr:hypothetical protein AMATHDRAFT_183195 [Amanita thiersii Skay4041]
MTFLLPLLLFVTHAVGLPVKNTFFDLQGHRGGRGDTVENTLPSFAWGMVSGVSTLEMDNGITKDGVVVVWHDEGITGDKCRDTGPLEGDPDFPYVGKKNIVNLTLAQLKTLDCGSERLHDFPLQLEYPGTRISTLKEVFDFVKCADPQRQMKFNIESKINPAIPGITLGVNDFVTKQHAEFVASGYDPSHITYQSFDWRTLVGMKALDPRFATAALMDDTTIKPGATGVSPWLGGIVIQDFPGGSVGAQVANAANSINADILSPTATATTSPVDDPSLPGYIPFTTKDMIDAAHADGMSVLPWTVSRLNIAEQLIDWGVDGLITDFPQHFHRWAEEKGLKVAPPFPEDRVLSCLNKHLQIS